MSLLNKADKIYVGQAVELVLIFRDGNKLIDDLDLASTLEIYFRLPDGTQLVRTAQYLELGKIKYDTDPLTDFQIAGLWEIQGLATFGGTRPVPSDSERFLVHPRI